MSILEEEAVKKEYNNNKDHKTSENINEERTNDNEKMC